MSVMAVSDWIIVGISGVSCSGKSTLAVKLHSLLCNSVLIQQDKYFLNDDDPRHVPCLLDTPHNDYDILSALDMQQMLMDINNTLKGATLWGNDRSDNKRYRCDERLLIVEGFTILNYKPIHDICTLRYYMDLDYWECLRRRSLRTYVPADVPGYFDKYVWPRHLHNKESLRAGNTVTVLSGADATESISRIIIQQLITYYGLVDDTAHDGLQ